MLRDSHYSWPTPMQFKPIADKIAEAHNKIFELSENTWMVYSVGIISTNEMCPASNDGVPRCDPPSGAGTPDQVQQRVRRHHPPGSVGPPANSRPLLGFHLTGWHDLGSHLHLRHWHMNLETLLPSQRNTNAYPFCSTNADASHHATTSHSSPSNARSDPEANRQQSGHPRQQCDPHQHHHHLRSIKTFSRQTPKKGRDI